MRQNHGFQSLLETALNSWWVLIEFLSTEKRISRKAPHKHILEELTPLRSQRLGLPRRAKLSRSFTEYPFTQAIFLVWVGRAEPFSGQTHEWPNGL